MYESTSEPDGVETTYKADVILYLVISVLLIYGAVIYLLYAAVNFFIQVLYYILPLRLQTAVNQMISYFTGSSNRFISSFGKVCSFPRDLFVSIHHRWLGSYWHHLLQYVHASSPSPIELFEVESLLSSQSGAKIKSHSQKIIMILEDMIQLLKICDDSDCEYYGDFLEYILSQLNKPHELDKIAANILKAYGGMGTLNDVTISKGTKVLFDEMTSFQNH